MKPRNEDQKLADAQGPAKKPRFKIEKLEERIAPKRCHYNRHGREVGCPQGPKT